MATFDRFDICEAHLALENDFHSGGWLHERPSNRRRREATHVQLERIGFSPGLSFNGFKSLSENGREIYLALCERYGFKVDSEGEPAKPCEKIEESGEPRGGRDWRPRSEADAYRFDGDEYIRCKCGFSVGEHAHEVIKAAGYNL